MPNFAEYFENLQEIQYDGARLSGASLDSRKVETGNIFFACKGKDNDGNCFAQSALDNGAGIVIMDNPKLYRAVSGNKALVDDSLRAALSMGAKKLAVAKALKIAVTGSYGKTGVKDMLKLVLSKRYKTFATKGNNNNMLGVSLTACGMDDDTEVAVFEIGSNSTGEISALSAAITPQIAVITGLGYAHIGKFGSLAEIAREKLSITDGLSGTGVMVINEVFKEGLARKNIEISNRSITFGRTNSADIRLLDCTIIGKSLTFTVLTTDGEYSCALNYCYPHVAENFLAVVGVGRLLAIPYETMVDSLKEYKLHSGRGDIIEAGDITIIDDCYNASLESVERAIDGLNLINVSPKYALIGEIGEIDGHEDFVYGRLMIKTKEYPNINFIFSGDSYLKYPETINVNIASGENGIEEQLNRLSKGVVLIKASRKYGFEKYRDLLLKRRGGTGAL